MLLLLACTILAPGQDLPVVNFGTTVVVPGGLEGVIYHISKNTLAIPNLQKEKPRGKIYTSSLNIPGRDFAEGFPGVSKRFEWFAIEYTGRFWIEKPGEYQFALMSDDGSRLYIDDRLVVNNDGIHAARTVAGGVELSGGVHKIRVQYFQGPKLQVALVLQVAGPDEELRVFSTDEFKPPSNPEDLRFPLP